MNMDEVEILADRLDPDTRKAILGIGRRLTEVAAIERDAYEIGCRHGAADVADELRAILAAGEGDVWPEVWLGQLTELEQRYPPIVDEETPA